jgi:hypothetical protein
VTDVVLVDTVTEPGTLTATAGTRTNGGAALVDVPAALPSRAERAADMLAKIGFGTAVAGVVRRDGTAPGTDPGAAA